MDCALRSIRLAVVLALLVAGPLVDACSCIPRRSVAESMESAHLVFLGTVERIDDRHAGWRSAWLSVRKFIGAEPKFSEADAHGFKITFRVTTIWKGPAKRTMSIFTGRGGGDCGYKFEIGKTYLVYAHCGDYCYTGICMRTTQSTKEDLAILSKLPTIALGD